MSCTPDKTTYRLLDPFAGWFQLPATHDVVGFNSERGLRLAGTGAIDCAGLERRLPPPRLAFDACACEWLLVTPRPSRVMRLGPCDCEWQPMWDERCAPFESEDLVAVAVERERFALADAAGNQVLHFARRGAALLGTTDIAGPRMLAYASRGELVVCADRPDATQVLLTVIDAHLLVRRRFNVQLPAATQAIAVRVHKTEAWLLCEGPPRTFKLLRVDIHTGDARAASMRDLQRALPVLPIAAATDAGFCINRGKQGDAPATVCFTWYGRCATRQDVGIDALPCAPRYLTLGEYFTEPLDSGIDECRWHRVALDVDLPAGARLTVSAATTANGQTPAGGFEWSSPARVDVPDFLIASPPGRYLHLRFVFEGDGNVTPLLQRARVEFPRATSLEHLPPVFRESGRHEDFTERFLALFDTILGDVDSAIERFPSLLDLGHCDDDVLPWLGTWLDVAYDSRWSPRVRRRVLRAIPSLYSRRGTVSGMRSALELVFGLQCGVEELGPERAFAALSFGAQLGSVRVFGRLSARMRLGSSRLCKAPLRSFGNPDRDALSANAFRFRVLVPPVASGSEPLTRRLAELVAAQKPAHTVETLRQRRVAWLVGSASGVGVDTMFGALPKPVLGSNGNIRLRRTSVLAPGSRPARRGAASASRLAVGISSHLE